MEHEGGRVSEG